MFKRKPKLSCVAQGIVNHIDANPDLWTKSETAAVYCYAAIINGEDIKILFSLHGSYVKPEGVDSLLTENDRSAISDAILRLNSHVSEKERQRLRLKSIKLIDFLQNLGCPK